LGRRQGGAGGLFGNLVLSCPKKVKKIKKVLTRKGWYDILNYTYAKVFFLCAKKMNFRLIGRRCTKECG
jgi:hypothetical protein